MIRKSSLTSRLRSEPDWHKGYGAAGNPLPAGEEKNRITHHLSPSRRDRRTQSASEGNGVGLESAALILAFSQREKESLLPFGRGQVEGALRVC